MKHVLTNGLKRFALDDLREEPWRNGGGITRTVAKREINRKTLWRISIADITGNEPFSRFDGTDREAVLVKGSSLTLCGDWGVSSMNEVGDKVRFPGELSVRAELAWPFARLWNVMAERDRVSSELQVKRVVQEDVGPICDGALFVMEGVADVIVNGHPLATLRKNDGLVFENWLNTLTLRFQGGPSHWLLTTLKMR